MKKYITKNPINKSFGITEYGIDYVKLANFIKILDEASCKLWLQVFYKRILEKPNDNFSKITRFLNMRLKTIHEENNNKG